MIYAKAVNFRIEDMTQISKINSLVLTVYATDANMYINVKGNVPGGLTMANEKRLIDANALIKEANADGAYGYVDAKQIADAPTVDAVEVVRCRDCIHAVEIEKDYISALFIDGTKQCELGRADTLFGYSIISNDGFCDSGERKDGDGNG